jgi:hypothetical protein
MGKLRSPDSVGMRYDSPPQPRLVTLKYKRFAKKMKDELSGERGRAERRAVSLPKFSWDKKDDA